MKKNIFILFLIFSCLSYAQDKKLTCLDFNKGEFRNINENSNFSSIIIRNGYKQLEVTDGIESYKRIEWQNDCDYVLLFSNKEAKKDNFKKFINKNGGIIVKTEKIEDNILYYKTSYFDGKQEIKGNGKLIKISSKASF